jgi:hypothetical protein
MRPHLNEKKCMRVIPDKVGSIKEEDGDPGQPRQKQDPISETTRAKSVGGMTQAVECLPSKSKVLSANPVPPKNPKNPQ